MKCLFIGPNPLAGIGQVTMRYAELMKGNYCQFDQNPTGEYDFGFAFILPVDWQLERIRSVFQKVCKKMAYMTVCETETVHESYGKLLEFQPIYCPSEFAQGVLKRQFPQGDWRILRHWIPEPPLTTGLRGTATGPYTFYSIGNIADPRKNISMLIKAFLELQLPGARLVLKATCKQEIKSQWPGVLIINGLIDNTQLDSIHDSCDCYINCSHSEGVGMGAVEAAMRNKPVIISEYGGLKEYVKTPYIVLCTLGPIGFNDFLYTPEMLWGHPSYEMLKTYMAQCYNLKLRTQDHSWTRSMVRSVETEFPLCTP